jgi:ABC-type sugar transport system, permease component
MRARAFTPWDIVRQVLVMAILVAFMFPLFWMLMTSFKSYGDILVSPPRWVFEPTLNNYVDAFQKADFAHYILNTLTVAALSTAIVIPTSALASYGFARYNVGGGNLMFFILTTRMMPPIAVVLPFFMIFKTLGATDIGSTLGLGLDQLGTLVVCYTIFNLPFAIWLMHSFFQDIPTEIEDSARLDGYSRWQVLRKVVLPLAAPGIAVTTIFCILFSWNEFLFASILTRSNAKTITMGVGDFWTQQGVLWGPLSAAAVVCVIPMIVMALILQRYIVRGLTFGAVRG